jgi:hypothetical protein
MVRMIWASSHQQQNVVADVQGLAHDLHVSEVKRLESPYEYRAVVPRGAASSLIISPDSIYALRHISQGKALALPLRGVLAERIVVQSGAKW